jgi:deoxyribodipyrimidine photo-lyase
VARSKKHKLALLWFRRDLRLTDNPALAHALEQSEQVIPVYIHAPEEEAPWQPGAASCWWLHHSLAALAQALRKQDSRLVFLQGPSASALRHMIAHTGASAVFWNRLYEPALIRRDTAIKRELNEQGIEAQSFNAALLVEPPFVLTQSGTPYKVFTAFYKACQQLPQPRVPGRTPRQFRPATRWPVGDKLADLQLLPQHPWIKKFDAYWQPGEAGARKRLNAFTDKVVDYPTARDLPGTDGVSYLSAHLHFGEVSPQQIWHSVTSSVAPAKCEVYLRQLVWRDFAHYVLYHFPETTQENFRREFDQFPWRRDKKILRAWTHGRTGIPLIDAGMRELWQCGWMHNRVRMNVASYLTKNALIHWLEGARWFWDTLVDADLANNTMGWQWSAGCGVDAAPYFRIFNPVRQAERFDAQGVYVSTWIPQLKALPNKFIHAPWQTPPEQLKRAEIDLNKDYCLPVLDLKKTRDRALAAYEAMRSYQ